MKVPKHTERSSISHESLSQVTPLCKVSVSPIEETYLRDEHYVWERPGASFDVLPGWFQQCNEKDAERNINWQSLENVLLIIIGMRIWRYRCEHCC